MTTTAEIARYAHLAEITPTTVPWTDFYTDAFEGQDDDAPHSYIDNCSRCGGRGGSEAWRHTGYNCYQCGGHNSSWTVNTTVGEMRKRARKHAQAYAGHVRKDIKAARAADAQLDQLRTAYPALHWFTWDGYRELVNAGDIWGDAEYILPEMLNEGRTLTPKQAAFAAKLLQRALNTRQIREARTAGWSNTVSAPAGKKVTVAGTIKTTFEKAGDYGTQWKMVIVTDEGWEAETTIPAPWLREVDHDAHALHGRTASFVAAELKPGHKNPGRAYTKGRGAQFKLAA